MQRKIIQVLLFAVSVGAFIDFNSESKKFFGDPECYWKNDSLFLVQKDVTIKLNHPNCIKLTWDVTKTGNQISINSTNNVLITKSTTEDALQIEFKTKTGTPCSAITAKLSTLLCTLPLLLISGFFVNIKKQILFSILLLFCASYGFSATDCTEPSVHIQFPVTFVSQLCINQEKCIPSMCNLAIYDQGPAAKGYSKVSSRNTILFSDQFCSIKKPKNWDEWVLYYFHTNRSTEEFYLMDNDNDGLVNILEYYADTDFTLTDSREQRSIDSDSYTDFDLEQQEKSRNRRAFEIIGSNPINPDSDSDLLLDGFESYNSMSPIKRDDTNADDDEDGLTNLQEQIRRTDPMNADSDSDGVNDGDEVKNNADPLNGLDGGRKPSSSDAFAIIQLIIGDPSGSHSERYNIQVGNIEHQAPDFGKIGIGRYKFNPGRYPITVHWVATNLQIPDFDYMARVSKVSGDLEVVIEDPDNLLGEWYDSDTDRTTDKTAWLIVKSHCPEDTNDQNKPSSCYDNCENCQTSSHRYWDDDDQTCKKSWANPLNYIIPTPCDYYCKKCEAWYKEEAKNTAWLEKLNRDIPCPCYAKDTGYELTSANKNPTVEWKVDSACAREGKSTEMWRSWLNCENGHTGAYGCMQSKASNGDPSQQCCYERIGEQFKWIPSGRPAAGTPDKSSSFFDHMEKDKDPYDWCCKNCKSEEQPKFCNYYIKGVRKGPDTCSNTT